MKVTVEREIFLKSLGHVQSVVERRNTIPILSNMLLQADQGVLKLTATDLDMEVVDSIAADVTTAGGVTVAAHILHDIVRKLPEGTQVALNYAADTGQLALSAGRSKFSLSSLPEDDFPDLACGEMPHRFSLGAKDLKRLIEKARFAISTEETRYYLNGIYLHVIEEDGKEMLRAVATDGHRLARIDLAAPAGSSDMPGIIVPRKAVGELHRLLEDLDQSIEVLVSDSKIRFEFGGVVLTSKLIEGTFPDYAKVIPVGNDKMMEVEARAFVQAVDRVSTISSEKGRAIKLNLEAGKLVLSVVNPDSGSANEELAVSYSAEPIEIGFNAKYLLDITSQLDQDSAVFSMADAGSPTIIQDKADDTALYVLMPMRV